MKRHDAEQGSYEWLALRAGIATASEADSLLTPAKLQRSSASEIGGAYYCRKLAERWLGMPLEDKGMSKAMDNGTVLEDHAIPKFELETGLDVERVGFLTDDSTTFGCSPDGLIVGATEGLECKCPEIQTHVKWLLAGVLPPDRRGQVQASMFVTGAPHWWFMSYCRGLPELIVKVARDDKYIAQLEYFLNGFNADLEAGYQKLLKLNGGVPPARPVNPDPEKDYFAEHFATPPAPTDADFEKWINSPGMVD